MPATETLPIDQLVEGFRDLSLLAEQWTHEAHLRTGLWFVSHYTEEEATIYLRAGIITFNHAKGGANTPTGGYHETITLFWITILSRFVRQFPAGTPFSEVEQQFLKSPFADKNLPFLYFSRERLLSTLARSRWIEPDLKPV